MNTEPIMPVVRRTRLGCVLASALVATVCASRLLAQEEVDARITQILADWKQRRGYPPIYYEVKGTVLNTKENVEGYNKLRKRDPSYQPKDNDLHWNCRLLLDVKGQRHRLEEEKEFFHLSKGTIRRASHINAFDGSMLTARDRNIVDGKEEKAKSSTPDVAVVTGNLAGAAFAQQLAPLFAGHGVVVFPPQDYIIPGDLDFEPNPSLMTVHGTDLFEGRRCLVLRSYPRAGTAFQEFWVDSVRTSALLRWLTYSSGFPVFEMNIRYNQHGSYWLVGSWTFEMRTWSPETKESSTSHVYRFTVARATLEQHLDESRFRLPIEPGMLVQRTHHDPKKNPVKEEQQGKPRYGRVDASGRESEVYFDRGVERTSWPPMLVWVSASLAGTLLLGYGAWRYWKRHQLLRAERPSSP